ncbi:MAG TPA: HEAT repeat domain-containing protein [Candidatus Dormibacteraeota bacterium]
MQARIGGPSSDEIGKSPRQRVLLLAMRIGEHAVADWCAELLNGMVRYDDPGRPSIQWLGGRHAAVEYGGDDEARRKDYWPRVWAAPGLLYAWDAAAGPAIVASLHDKAWRVREMSAKVVRLRAIAQAEPILSRLLDDPVARVRAAAEAALAELASLDRSTESGRSPE